MISRGERGRHRDRERVQEKTIYRYTDKDRVKSKIQKVRHNMMLLYSRFICCVAEIWHVPGIGGKISDPAEWHPPEIK